MGRNALGVERSFLRAITGTWSLLLTLEEWFAITQNNGVIDPFLNGHGDSGSKAKLVEGVGITARPETVFYEGLKQV